VASEAAQVQVHPLAPAALQMASGPLPQGQQTQDVAESSKPSGEAWPSPRRGDIQGALLQPSLAAAAAAAAAALGMASQPHVSIITIQPPQHPPPPPDHYSNPPETTSAPMAHAAACITKALPGSAAPDAASTAGVISRPSDLPSGSLHGQHAPASGGLWPDFVGDDDGEHPAQPGSRPSQRPAPAALSVSERVVVVSDAARAAVAWDADGQSAADNRDGANHNRTAGASQPHLGKRWPADAAAAPITQHHPHAARLSGGTVAGPIGRGEPSSPPLAELSGGWVNRDCGELPLLVRDPTPVLVTPGGAGGAAVESLLHWQALKQLHGAGVAVGKGGHAAAATGAGALAQSRVLQFDSSIGSHGAFVVTEVTPANEGSISGTPDLTPASSHLAHCDLVSDGRLVHSAAVDGMVSGQLAFLRPSSLAGTTAAGAAAVPHSGGYAESCEEAGASSLCELASELTLTSPPESARRPASGGGLQESLPYRGSPTAAAPAPAQHSGSRVAHQKQLAARKAGLLHEVGSSGRDGRGQEPTKAQGMSKSASDAEAGSDDPLAALAKHLDAPLSATAKTQGGVRAAEHNSGCGLRIHAPAWLAWHRRAALAGPTHATQSPASAATVRRASAMPAAGCGGSALQSADSGRGGEVAAGDLSSVVGALRPEHLNRPETASLHVSVDTVGDRARKRGGDHLASGNWAHSSAAAPAAGADKRVVQGVNGDDFRVSWPLTGSGAGTGGGPGPGSTMLLPPRLGAQRSAAAWGTSGPPQPAQHRLGQQHQLGPDLLDLIHQVRPPLWVGWVEKTGGVCSGLVCCT
jgi:hypothetical protein